ncbi:MAG: hypothetical protein MN733_06870 [Nitrososphaera sp.]|nr:hypothetical protein [Nitrososphaera sp.]
MDTGLQSGSGIARGKTRMAMVAAIVAAVIAGILALTSYNLSSDLASKSAVIDQQDQKIEQYMTAISAQKQEISEKSEQLEELDSQIEALSQKVASKDQALAEKAQEADSLADRMESMNGQLEDLQKQSTLLQTEIEALQAKIQTNEQRIAELMQINLEAPKHVTISHFGLAVDENQEGTVFPIQVEIIDSGSGVVSVDVSKVEYEPSFQSTVRIAAAAASGYTGTPISDKNIIVRMIGDYSDGGAVRVDGTSAGALIAGMIAAGLSDKEINSAVLVTGTIGGDGSIGKIGSLEEKTAAADSFGVETMLVPKSQEFDSAEITIIGVSDIDEMMKHLVLS